MKKFIYFFRVLLIFGIFNLVNLIIYDGGAGMEPVWGLLIVCSAFLSVNRIYTFFFSKKWVKVTFLSLLILFIFVESLIIYNGFKTDLNDKSDYIIVLGARVKGEVPSLALKYRLEKAYEYMSNNPETKAILSGGKGDGENISEAEAMRRYLVGRGISEERLILEDRSTSTDENIINSFEIINEENPESKIIVITSRFHILRSKMIAKEFGREVDGIGAKTMQFLIPNYYLREFFAVISEFVM